MKRRKYTREEKDFLKRMKKRLASRPTAQKREVIIKRGKLPAKKDQRELQKKVSQKIVRKIKQPSLIGKVVKSFGYQRKLSSSLRDFGGAKNLPVKAKASKRTIAVQRGLSRRQLPPRNLRGGRPTAPPQQFQRPDEDGVWAKNENSQIGSKMPPSKIWANRPIYGYEGDLAGNVKLKEFGTEASFFN